MRRLLRDLLSWGSLTLLIVLLALFAWATHRPDAPALVAAESWPVAGPWVARFRARYAPPPSAEPFPPTVEPVAGRDAWSPGPEGEPGVPSPPPAGAAQTDAAWVAAGEPIRESPDETAAVRGRLAHALRLDVLERRGEWGRVVAPAGHGWVRLLPVVGAGGDDEPPLGRAVVPPLPLPGRPADAEVLATAVELLGIAGPVGRLGAYALYSDLPPASLVPLERVVAGIEPAYRARYGRSPVGTPQESVILFRREADYRRFQAASDVKLAGLPAAGHAIRGVAAAYDARQGPAELAATLVHEIVHLLNRRALGPALPPWLDEGIADDLGGSQIDPDGTLTPERIGGTVRQSPGRWELRGGVATLHQVDDAFAAGTAAPLARLTAMDWDDFVHSEQRGLHYAQAGLFVRYLLDGGDPGLAAGFRRFLARVAEGGDPQGEALRRELGCPWDELESGMAAWVAGEVRASQPALRSPRSR